MLGLLKPIDRPLPPALRHSWSRKQPLDFIAITSVDAKYISNGEIMVWSLDHPDLIAGAEFALDDNSQVSPGTHRLGEATRKHVIVHSNPEPPTGYSRLGNLNNSSPDLPTLADQRFVDVDPFSGEVFAKLTECQRPVDLLFPPPSVFDRVGVDCLIGSAVSLA